MFLLEPFRKTDDWHYGISFEYGIDFAVWMLEHDGLLVPPFDKHAPQPDAGILEPLSGDPQAPPANWHFPQANALQPLGLDQENWRIWFYRLVEDVMEEKIRLLTDPRPVQRKSLTDPAALNPGSETLQSLLRERYDYYRKSVVNQRRANERSLADLHIHGKNGREKWRLMSEARGHLPPVHYFLTGYPFAVIDAVEPSSVVLSFGSDLPSETVYWNTLLHGLQRLQE